MEGHRAGGPGGFLKAQHDYIERTHCSHQLNRIRALTNVDLSGGSDALQDVIRSTAVQHRPNSDVISQVLKNFRGDPNSPQSDEALIRAIYAERGRRNPDGTLAHFTKNSRKVQAGVSDLGKEQQDAALRMLGGPQPAR